MKLVLCTNCGSVFSLAVGRVKTCDCGQCSGQYTDNLYAEYTGINAIPLGFANQSLVGAIKNQPENGMGKEFTAFVIPKDCGTLRRR